MYSVVLALRCLLKSFHALNTSFLVIEYLLGKGQSVVLHDCIDLGIGAGYCTLERQRLPARTQTALVDWVVNGRSCQQYVLLSLAKFVFRT